MLPVVKELVSRSGEVAQKTHKPVELPIEPDVFKDFPSLKKWLTAKYNVAVQICNGEIKAHHTEPEADLRQRWLDMLDEVVKALHRNFKPEASNDRVTALWWNCSEIIDAVNAVMAELTLKYGQRTAHLYDKPAEGKWLALKRSELRRRMVSKLVVLWVLRRWFAVNSVKAGVSLPPPLEATKGFDAVIRLTDGSRILVRIVVKYVDDQHVSLKARSSTFYWDTTKQTEHELFLTLSIPASRKACTDQQLLAHFGNNELVKAITEWAEKNLQQS